MQGLSMEKLLSERKTYMQNRCPAYRLDCALVETLEDILRNWDGDFGPAFCGYAEARRRDALEQCRIYYERAQELCRAWPGERVMELEDLDRLGEGVDTGEAVKARMEEAKQAARQEHFGLASLLEMYIDAVDDKLMIEESFCCVFGARDSGGDGKAVEQVKLFREPDRTLDVPWVNPEWWREK